MSPLLLQRPDLQAKEGAQVAECSTPHIQGSSQSSAG